MSDVGMRPLETSTAAEKEERTGERVALRSRRMCDASPWVWNAQTERRGGTIQFDVRPGNGTSFAVANVAGLAALWLAHHGGALDRYGAHLPAVFKQLLIETCRTPDGWDKRHFGAGIVDAERLLSATLPPQPPARGMRSLRAAAVSPVDSSGLRKIQHLFEDASPLALRNALAQLLEIDDRQLDAHLERVADELCMHLALDPTLHAHVQAMLRLADTPRQRFADARGPGPLQQTARTRLANVASPTLLDHGV